MFRNTALSLCLIIGGKSIGFSQDLIFHHYSVNDGLASSQVDDIIQDKYNRLWFATERGLSCYDGYHFKSYTADDSLPANNLFKFYPGPNGEIWCTSFSRRLFSFSGYKPVFKPYKFNDSLVALPDRYITNSLLVTKDGTVYMSMVDGLGLVKITPEGKLTHSLHVGLTGLPNWELHVFTSNDSYVFSYSDEHINQILNPTIPFKKITVKHAFEQNNHYKACYVPATGQTVYVEGSRITIIEPNGQLTRIPTEHRPISVGTFNDSLFWVGMLYGGVNLYNLKGEKKASYLHGQSVTKLLVDHENGYWISTLNDGVYHAVNTTLYYYPHEEKERNWVHTLASDKKGNLYVGYYNGDITRIHHNSMVPYFTSKEKMPSLLFYNAVSHNLFYNTDYYLYSNKPGYKPVFIGVNAMNIFVNESDTAYLSAYGSFYIAYNGHRQSVSTGYRIMDMCFLNGWYYLATNSGLFRWKSGQKEPEAYLPEKFAQYKIGTLETFNGGLLIASKDGLLYWKKNKLITVTTADGLADKHLRSLYVENDSVIWSCSNKGLNRVTYVKKGKPVVQAFTNKHGLVCNEISDVEIVNDTVWVGTYQGLCSIPLKMLNEPPAFSIDYKPMLATLRVNDRTREFQNDMELSYSENRVEISFKGISFNENKPLVYRYMLMGLENKWNYTTSRSALYTSLPYGDYKFILQVKGGNANWKKGEQSFSFIITPPFWKTWWFLITVIAGLVLLVYLFFRFRILSYNRDITRELLRQLLKRIRKKPMYVVVREQGKDIRIASGIICYVKSDGNYIEIHTDTKKYVTRYKIGEFLDLVPDPLEYLRISRSCIIRLDKVQEKSKKDVTVKGEKLPVGETYLDQLQKIQF